MRRGLVLGKFMPIHSGHVNLINYALTVCDEVIVWVCVSYNESMPSEFRIKCVQDIFYENQRVKPVLFEYDEVLLPNTSESSVDVSKVWAQAIKENLPKIDVVVSCEPYGDFLAGYLDCEHYMYPHQKEISATQIRSNPQAHQKHIPDPVKTYYHKKVCILGTESTGKSTLVKRLTKHFQGQYVSEVGRDIVQQSQECKPEDLQHIAHEHARAIVEMSKKLPHLLFIDTDINITKSYSKFLFNEDLIVEPHVEEANRCDLYLYLNNDVPFIQDGTRLTESERNRLDCYHRRQLEEVNINS